jgi:hypothetical protein
MFVMTEYPPDILPLYAQGYALARFLIDQKGKHEFLAYLKDGMSSDDWTSATDRHYGYKNLAVLQNSWLDWIKQGSPLRNPAPGAAEMIAAAGKPRSQPNMVVRAQSSDHDSPQMIPVRSAPAPIRLASASLPPGPRQARTDNSPIRNGSVVIDRGEPVVAMAGNANADSTPAAAAEPKALPASVTFSADGLWKSATASASDSSQTAFSSPGKSVYGEGVGMLRHSQVAQRVPTESPAQPTDESKTPAASPDHSKQVILEWSR